MKIDIYNHIFPQNYFDEYIAGPKALPDIGKRVRNMPTIVNLDARFKVMDEFGDYCQFLSLPSPPLESMASPERSPLLARAANDGLAELVKKHPDRFIGFAASLPMTTRNTNPRTR